MNEQDTRLYKQEYPRLLRQLDRLVDLSQDGDPNVATLILFGSTARFEPHRSSDVDVLMLLHDHYRFYREHVPGQGIRLLSEAEQSPIDRPCRWYFGCVVDDDRASHLDEEFLENVAQHGVLLYEQPGYTVPAVLAGLTPFSVWKERVEDLLATCKQRMRRAS